MPIIRLSKVLEAIEAYNKHISEMKVFPDMPSFSPSFMDAAYKYNKLNEAEKEEFKKLTCP